MPEIDPSFPRAWIEFADPGTPDQLIRADLTWLTSRWHCIFGAGCPGIDQNLPTGGCCSFGAHFADDADLARVAGQVELLTPDEWQLHDEIGHAPDQWLESDEEGDRKTRTVDGGCVFLNGPRFEAGPGCALHLLARRLGVSHVRTKPDVCWQLPIRRDYEERRHADGQVVTVIVITEYVRAMWGPGGHDLDWYCSANTEAHTAGEPVYLSNREELIELIGAGGYDLLAEYCAAHEQGGRELALHPAGQPGVV